MMWIGVMLFCTDVSNVDTCQAFVRNQSLFQTEEECRKVVPQELADLLLKFGGTGHSNCLPLPQTGLAA